jgi:CRP-like cAMP-binding protein
MEQQAASAGLTGASATRAANLWSSLHTAGRLPHGRDLWRHLTEALDLARFVPVPASGVEASHLHSRDGEPYHVLRSPAGHYLRLGPPDFALWSRMDGRRTVHDLAAERFLEVGDFAANRLSRLVSDLRAGGFLIPPPRDCYAALDRALGAKRPSRRLRARVHDLLAPPRLRLEDVDWAFARVNAAIGGLVYNPVTKLVSIVVVLIGLAVLAYQLIAAGYPLFETRGSFILGLATLIALDALGVTISNLAQGLTIARHGRRVNAVGVMFHFVVPAVYVETTDIWLASRQQRISAALAGPWAMLVLGCLFAILTVPLDASGFGSVLFKAATIWIANALFNLLPVLDLTGYFVLVDYFEMPALKENALGFIRRGLLAKLRERKPLTRHERIFTIVGLIWGVGIVVAPLAVVGARELRYTDTLVRLWNDGQIISRPLAIGMALLFLGPAAGGVIRLVVRAVTRAVANVRRSLAAWRRRVPASYVEALAGLPFLRDAGREEIAAIARHVHQHDLSAGTIVVRQGAPGDRFYIVRRGVVRVGKITADGRAVGLAELGPGDYFGETALLARVARTATVIAESDVRLLSLDAGHFRRWLGARIDLTSAVRRGLVERRQLAHFPLFSALGPSELDRLTELLLATRYSAGDVIVRQGDPGDRFFLIADGRVEVLRAEEGRSERVAELGVGQYFGEVALLFEEPRTATVRAVTAVETYTLSADDFRALLGRLPTAPEIRRTAAVRARLGDRPTVVAHRPPVS